MTSGEVRSLLRSVRWVPVSRALLLGVGLLALSACRSPARPLSQKLIPAQKDVLHVEIELASAVQPEQYRDLAEDRLATLTGPDGTGRRSVYRDAPLYEIRYSFHAGSTLLASVLYRLRDEVGFEHQHTFVHPGGLSR